MFSINIIIKICASIVFISTIALAQHVIHFDEEGDACLDEVGLGTCTKTSNCVDTFNKTQRQTFPNKCLTKDGSYLICCHSNKQVEAETNFDVSSIHVQKCMEYSASLFKRVRRHQAPLLDTYPSEPAIYFGIEAKKEEFPHMALIGYGIGNTKHWECGGTLISKRFVLTAGHCLYNRIHGDARFVKLTDKYIVFGSNQKDYSQNFNVIERITHPDYNGIDQYNDIGLLKLNKNAVFNKHIRPACLSHRNLRLIKKATATGWGETEHSERTNALLKVDLNLVSIDSCNASYTRELIKKQLPQGILKEIQFCAGGSFDGKDTCQGDSGGPLQIFSNHPGLLEVIGITSLGSACGTYYLPGIYTRVSAFIPWIEQHVWK